MGLALYLDVTTMRMDNGLNKTKSQTSPAFGATLVSPEKAIKNLG
jgi:hypothetical protein